MSGPLIASSLPTMPSSSIQPRPQMHLERLSRKLKQAFMPITAPIAEWLQSNRPILRRDVPFGTDRPQLLGNLCRMKIYFCICFISDLICAVLHPIIQHFYTLNYISETRAPETLKSIVTISKSSIVLMSCGTYAKYEIRRLYLLQSHRTGLVLNQLWFLFGMSLSMYSTLCFLGLIIMRRADALWWEYVLSTSIVLIWTVIMRSDLKWIGWGMPGFRAETRVPLHSWF